MGKFGNCCCTPPSRLMAMVQTQHFGWNQLNFSDFDTTYADVAPGDIASCFSPAITIIEAVDTSGELIRRFMGWRRVRKQTTEYGELRHDIYEIERDARQGMTLYESTEDSYGGLQRYTRAWGIPTVHDEATGDYPLGSDPAKDNATLLASSIKIRRRTLTVTEDSYLFRVEGILIGVGDESFLFEEEFHFFGPNTDSDVMGYANELLALYNLETETFDGDPLPALALESNGWLTNGWTAEGSEEAGYAMTPVPPFEATPGLSFSIYDLVTAGVGTVINWNYRNPKWLAFSACMVDPVGDTPYAFASKVYFAGEAGICIQRLKLLSYDGATHDDVTYQSIINCSETIPCTAGCEVSCDQLNEVCVVYAWSEWDDLEAFHSMPACCSVPP